MLCQKVVTPFFSAYCEGRGRLVTHKASHYPDQLSTLTHAHAHTHKCTRSDLGARPVCTISKEVFRSHQSSMNTDSEEISGGERVKQMFPPMCTTALCFVNSGGRSLRDRIEGEIRYDAWNFSVHTRLQTHKDLHTKREASKLPEYVIKNTFYCIQIHV